MNDPATSKSPYCLPRRLRPKGLRVYRLRKPVVLPFFIPDPAAVVQRVQAASGREVGMAGGERQCVSYPLSGIVPVSQEEYLKRHPERAGLFHPATPSACAQRGPLALLAQRRPAGYDKLSPEAQWGIDKNLGILDWDGDERK